MDPELRTCAFCLVAEFHAERGATIAHAYPGTPSVDESALAQQMLPDRMHTHSEDWTLILMHPRHANRIGAVRIHPSVASGAEGPSPLCIPCIARTVPDADAARGASMVAIAIGTMYPHVTVFKPALMLALDEYISTRAAHVPHKLYAALNSINMTRVPCLSRAEKLRMRDAPMRTVTHRPANARAIAISRPRPAMPTRTHIVAMPYGAVELSLALPLDIFPGDVGDYSLTRLLTAYAPPRSSDTPHALATLVHALIARARVLFVSHTLALTAVRHVLAAAALARGDPLSPGAAYMPPHSNVPVYPYVTLANVAHLELASGYIAGTTNAQLAELDVWDVLCDVDTGTVRTRGERTHKPPRASAPCADALLLAGVLISIESHASEAYVRACMRTFVRAKQRESAGHAALARLARTAHRGDDLGDTHAIEQVLRTLAAFAENDIDTLCAHIDAPILTTLAHALCYPHDAVRSLAACVLERISMAGVSLCTLNRFHRIALLHVIQDVLPHVSTANTAGLARRAECGMSRDFAP